MKANYPLKVSRKLTTQGSNLVNLQITRVAPYQIWAKRSLIKRLSYANYTMKKRSYYVWQRSNKMTRSQTRVSSKTMILTIRSNYLTAKARVKSQRRAVYWILGRQGPRTKTKIRLSGRQGSALMSTTWTRVNCLNLLCRTKTWVSEKARTSPLWRSLKRSQRLQSRKNLRSQHHVKTDRQAALRRGLVKTALSCSLVCRK